MDLFCPCEGRSAPSWIIACNDVFGQFLSARKPFLNLALNILEFGDFYSLLEGSFEHVKVLSDDVSASCECRANDLDALKWCNLLTQLEIKSQRGRAMWSGALLRMKNTTRPRQLHTHTHTAGFITSYLTMTKSAYWPFKASVVVNTSVLSNNKCVCVGVWERMCRGHSLPCRSCRQL